MILMGRAHFARYSPLNFYKMQKSEKTTIKNRKDQNIAVLIEEVENHKGLVFVMHGLGGFKEQPHIIAVAEAFKEKDFAVVRFDVTNSIGESDGKYENATATNYYEDLEDVIKWAESKLWYQEPFWLTGHSLGAFSSVLYAMNFPDKIKSIVPLSLIVSGDHNIEISKNSGFLDSWEKTGWYERKSIFDPGVIYKLKYAFVTDMMRYDLLKKNKDIAAPVLLIVGDNDDILKTGHIKLLFNKITSQKEFHIIKKGDR